MKKTSVFIPTSVNFSILFLKQTTTHDVIQTYMLVMDLFQEVLNSGAYVIGGSVRNNSMMIMESGYG